MKKHAQRIKHQGKEYVLDVEATKKLQKREAAKRTANRYVSDDVEQATRYLQGVVVLDGDGLIDLDSDYQYWIAIVHDGSGYTPGAAVVALDDIESHPDAAIQAAYEVLEYRAMEDTDYIKELQDEWGDEWMDILTEGWDGMAFGPFDAATTADIIRSDKYAMKYIDIEEAEEDEYDEDY